MSGMQEGQEQQKKAESDETREGGEGGLEEQHLALRLEDRVRDANGYDATVRYLGPVCTAKDPQALWVGVEFDDPDRGKHDGAAVDKTTGEATRYFRCTKGGSGSFLKPNKVDRGCSFVQALANQYVHLNAPLEAPDNVFAKEVFANTSKGGKKSIEFYGEAKIRKRQQVGVLDKCTVREMGISHAGPVDAIAEAAGHFVGLDLKSNLLSDWKEVGLICSQMPLLEELAVGCNGFKSTELRGETLGPLLSSALLNVSVLVLNSAGLVSWRQVQLLETGLPKLEELYLAGNELGDILSVLSSGEDGKEPQQQQQQQTSAPPEEEDSSSSGAATVTGMAQLRTLDLSDTGITSWQQVAAFSALPHLAVLSLNHNLIPEVPPLATTASTSLAFCSLESISLSRNDISSWASVDRLGGLPKLRSLRFSNNPVTSKWGASEARTIAVARVPNLMRFNGSEVSQRERVEAEKAYLRMIVREASAVREINKALDKDQADALMAEIHPRFKALMSVFGDMLVSRAPSEGGGEQAGTLAADMVTVTLTPMAANSVGVEPKSKKLPASLTVGRLKGMCKRLFQLDIHLQVLYFRSAKDSPPVMLDDDDQTLGFFGVCEGAEVFMNEVDERAQALEKENKQREHEERVRREMEHVGKLEAVRRSNVARESMAAQQAGK